MPSNEPILFLWSMSPWASKVTAYLALRGIPYTQCIQPITLPRPNIAALGIKYRRIPVLSLGRDIYCDTLLMLEKFEKWYPNDEYKSLGATDPTGRALEKLLEKWTDVVVFPPAAAAIPSEMDLLKDPNFQKDREELWGRPWSKEEQDRLKPAALANLRANFEFLEDLLGDDREWVLGSEGPKLADIHACWIFDWMLQLPNAMPEDFFSKERYPRTLAWRERYNAAVAKAKDDSQPKQIEGLDAVRKILDSPLEEEKLTFDADPSGISQEDEVEIFPIDTGYKHRDQGKLVGFTFDEAVLLGRTQQEGNEIRIHYPRWNYSVKPARVDEKVGSD